MYYFGVKWRSNESVQLILVISSNIVIYSNYFFRDLNFIGYVYSIFAWYERDTILKDGFFNFEISKEIIVFEFFVS